MAAASIVASAGSLFSARRYSEAERMLSAAIARCVDDEILEQLLYHRGRCLRKLALHAACAEDFSRVVQHGGKLASVARAYRGTALAELGLITLAVQDYTVALDERADDYPTRLNRGEALLNIGRAREALQDVEVYVGAFPDNVDGRVLQGQANIALGRTNAAMVELERALQLEPGHPVATALYDNLQQECNEKVRLVAAVGGGGDARPGAAHAEGGAATKPILKHSAAAAAAAAAATVGELASSSASGSASATIDDQALLSPNRRHLFVRTPHTGPSSALNSPERMSGGSGALSRGVAPGAVAAAWGSGSAADDDSFACVGDSSSVLAAMVGDGSDGASPGGVDDCSDVSVDASAVPSTIGTALKPCARARPAATMTALQSSKKRARTGAPSVAVRSGVAWGVVSVRQHHRELGGSGGVPINGGISLGITNEHEDLDPLHLDAFEEKRQKEQRVAKEHLEPASEILRRRILCDAMGKSEFERRLSEEVRENKRIRASRDDSVINDSRMNPEFGTLQIVVPRENEQLAMGADSGGWGASELHFGGEGGHYAFAYGEKQAQHLDVDREISKHTEAAKLATVLSY